MNRRLLALALTLVVALAPGCMLGRGKAEKPPKESKTPARDVDAGYKKRWVEKRASELVAQGLTTSAALVRAEQEFGANFEYLSPEKK